MSEQILRALIAEIHDLRARLAALEGSEYIANAGLLDGLHAAAFALSGHNHDAVYAALSHNHDHGALTGRGDDDHTQYYNAARHTAAVHNSLGLDHGSLSGRGDDDHTQYLLASGARALSNNWDAGNYQVRARTFYADVATGTAPLTIASTTRVANLNADLLDGLHANATGAANAHVIATDANGAATVVDLTATGGLNVGTATGAGAGQLYLAGSKNQVVARLYHNNDDGVSLRLRVDDANEFASIYAYDENDGGTAGYVPLYLGHANNAANSLIVNGATGRVLIGTSTDDGVNKLQVNGSVKATYAEMNWLQILDGIAAPAKVEGLARIYVDSADGDLKIKFGDGTVKTIVTD